MQMKDKTKKAFMAPSKATSPMIQPSASKKENIPAAAKNDHTIILIPKYLILDEIQISIDS